MPPAPASTNLLKKIPAWLWLVAFLAMTLVIGCMLWFFQQKPETPANVRAMETEVPRTRVTSSERVEDAFGWGSELRIDKKPNMPATIRFMVHDAERKPVRNANVKITFVRPARDVKGASLVLDMDEPGVYRGIIDLPQGGLWEAHVSVAIGKSVYQVTKRAMLP